VGEEALDQADDGLLGGPPHAGGSLLVLGVGDLAVEGEDIGHLGVELGVNRGDGVRVRGDVSLGGLERLDERVIPRVGLVLVQVELLSQLADAAHEVISGRAGLLAEQFDLDQNQANPGDDSLVKSFQAAKADITSHSDAITSIDAQLNAKMADVLALDSQITNAQNEEAAARMWWSTKESVVGLIKGLLPHVDSIEATLKNLNNNVQQLKSEISRAKAGQKAAAASVKALAAQILSNQPIDQAKCAKLLSSGLSAAAAPSKL